MTISPALLRRIRQAFRLDLDGIHGLAHWGRVWANGRLLAGANGANPRVVAHFAFLHDSCREADGADPDHGPRAAEFARSLKRHMDLDDAEFRLLCRALERHTGGRHPGDLTIATCWDADRLDLGRIGVRPDPRYLCTAEGRQPDTIAWASARAQAWLEARWRRSAREGG